jgi:mono/diheme cytochrome c family protein
VRTYWWSALVLFCALTFGRTGGHAQQGLASAPTYTHAQVQSVLNEYCVTCHNARLKTASLELDGKDLTRLDLDVAAWESVVRKLRTGMMPPPSVKRPERAMLDAVAAWLETGLDRAAARAPNPGSPSVHRMNRHEYANAVRDLLDLHVDVTTLLPNDSTVAGFDNIADVLGTSPALIQAYVSAAMKISRLAIGDLSAPAVPVTYSAPAGLSQSAHVEGLPLGTQGGMIVRHTFPLDAEYQIQAGGGRVDVTIDGTPVPAGRGRIPIPAGPHTIGVATVPVFDTAGLDGIFSAPPGRGRGMTLTITGPYRPSGPGDTPSRRRIFVCRPSAADQEASPASAQASAGSRRSAQEIRASEDGCARTILRTLARRAFRRQVPDDDPSLQTLMGFFAQGRSAGTFDAGIQQALARVLVDPQFVFRMEHVPARLAPGAVYRLTDTEIATRLSFFLWSSIPDDTLLDLAIAGKLSDPAVLERETRRMLADPKSKSLIDNFASQWMHLRELENAQPESPDFDGSLRVSFAREMQLFFESIVREDRSIIDVLDADYTYVDERLARHYGISDVKGSFFRRVPLDADHPRRGVLGKGSILLVTSAANRTSPVERGQWVLENLLGSPAPNPPPGVETNLDQGADTGRAKTLRERMDLHRTQPACSACHSIMDPIGFSLEHFDLVGKWRELDEGSPIDATGRLVDGTRLDGPASLRRALLGRPDAFVTTATEKLLTYAVGRVVTASDMPAVRTIVRSAARDQYRFSSLVVGVVHSGPFQMRIKDGTVPAAAAP